MTSLASTTSSPALAGVTAYMPWPNSSLANVTPASYADIPQPLSARHIIIVSVLYSLIVLLSVTGNIATLWVFTRGPRNCQADIRLWLINLAVADLLMSIFCIPFTSAMSMLDQWIFPKAMCPFVLFIQNLSVTASVYTNMALGVDRYLVVAHPLRSRRWSGRAKFSIPFIWLIGIAFSGVNLKVARAFVRSIDPISGNEYLGCQELWEDPRDQITYSLASFVLTYVTPLALLAFFYARIAQLLRRKTPMLSVTMKHASKSHSRSKRKVIKMLVIVVSMFALCWAPLHLFFLLLTFVKPPLTDSVSDSVLVALYFSVHVLAMCNSFTNPLVYGFLNDTFRLDLKELLARNFLCNCCCPQLKQTLLSKLMARRASTTRLMHSQHALRKHVRETKRNPEPESPSEKEPFCNGRVISRMQSDVSASTVLPQTPTEEVLQNFTERNSLEANVSKPSVIDNTELERSPLVPDLVHDVQDLQSKTSLDNSRCN